MRKSSIAFAILCSAAVVGPRVQAARSDEDSSVITVEGQHNGNPLEAKIHFGSDTRTISVVGQGKLSVAPDIAEISVGVITSAPTAKEALASNNEAMSSLQSVLKERGVAAKDIETTQISVNPQYSQPSPPMPGQPPVRDFVPKIVGYQVTNTVKITARDIKKLGSLLDAVVQAGANQMYGISFRVDEPEKLLDGVRKNAMADAKRKAELLAGEAGMVVGRPISIREEGAPAPPPRPMMARRAFAAEAAVPISAGEQDLGLSVHIVYELKVPK